MSEMLEAAETAERGLASETVNQFGWLVKSLAAKFAGQASSLREDLEQIGFEELIKATRAWRPGKQAIATFAYARIRGAMLNHIDRDEPPPNEVFSLSTVVGEDETGYPITIADALIDPGPGPEEAFLHEERLEILRKGLESVVSDKERELIQYRFRDDLSVEEIGRLLGITHVAVLKRLQKTLGKLRSFIEEQE